MNRAFFAVTALLLCVAAGFAQDEAQYSTWMKSVNPSVRALTTAIAAKDNAAVATEANKLAATFEQVAGFWTARKTDDAVKFAQTARDGFKAVAAATDPDAQTAALKTAQAACGQCHGAHRGGSPGAFAIK